jgi:hypothetical protein
MQCIILYLLRVKSNLSAQHSGTTCTLANRYFPSFRYHKHHISKVALQNAHPSHLATNVTSPTTNYPTSTSTSNSIIINHHCRPQLTSFPPKAATSHNNCRLQHKTWPAGQVRLTSCQLFAAVPIRMLSLCIATYLGWGVNACGHLGGKALR